MLLIAPARAADATLARAFEPLLSAISIEAMREGSLMVDGQKKVTPIQAAAWLTREMRLD